MKLLQLIFITWIISSGYAWESEQLEVFDVVDEVKQDFYELLNVSKDATSADIRSAFRSLSLKLHPDKNLEVDTSEKFRNLVSVYEVLRSSTKRKHYDDILINGLPNWRSGLFYYRYVRKMGITEVVLILLIVCTVGQYLVNWGVYFEKKIAVQDQLRSKRKQGRKSKSDVLPDMILPKPSVFDTLPIQIPLLMWNTILSVPFALGMIKDIVKQKYEIKMSREPEPTPVKMRSSRKRKKFVLPEGPNFVVYQSNIDKGTTKSSSSPPAVHGGFWTDDDLIELIRLVKKFPQGFSHRWESIAEVLGRSVVEVTYMSNKLKENGYRIPSEQDEIQTRIKQKTKKDCMNDSVKKWSQIQQKALEDALPKFPKGCPDRWDRISEHVPNKTKEDCMLRFKYLAECLKKQKESSEKTENAEGNIVMRNELNP